MKKACVALVCTVIAGASLAAQIPGSMQNTGAVILSATVEAQNLMSISPSQLDIVFDQSSVNDVFDVQCVVMSRAWWTLRIQSANHGYVVNKDYPQYRIAYSISIPALQNPSVLLDRPWTSAPQSPTLEEGLPVLIQVSFFSPTVTMPRGAYCDQLVLSLARH